MAETLITLTIIGVVAALTIPTLMTKYQKHQYVVGLKKAYSQLQNAIQMVPISRGCSAGDFDCAGWNTQGSKNDDGTYNDGIFDDIDGQTFNRTNAFRLYLLSKQLKVSKRCFNNDILECLSPIYYIDLPKNDPHTRYNDEYSGYAFATEDGMTFFTDYVSTSTLGSFLIEVDINGKKGPNIYGRDIFLFESTDNPVTITPLKWGESYCSEKIKWGDTSCAFKVLKEGAMNY